MWVVLSLVSALTLAFRDVFIKMLSKNNHIYWIIMVSQILSGLVIMAYFFIMGPVDINTYLQADVWWVFAILLPIDILVFTLYFLALKSSPLSVTIPFLAFTPVLLPLTSWLILGEGVTPFAFGGILLVTVGAYFLFFKKGEDWLAPFRHFTKERGSVFMLIVSVLFSISGVLGRYLILKIGLANVSSVYPLVLGLGMMVVFLFTKKIRRNDVGFHQPLIWVVMILSSSVMIITHFSAIAETNAAYMMSVKRSSLLFTLLLSAVFFKEKDLRQKLLAVCVMLLGVALVVFGSTTSP